MGQSVVDGRFERKIGEREVVDFVEAFRVKEKSVLRVSVSGIGLSLIFELRWRKWREKNSAGQLHVAADGGPSRSSCGRKTSRSLREGTSDDDKNRWRVVVPTWGAYSRTIGTMAGWHRRGGGLVAQVVG